ncbi:unnamed protein product, partial [Didymodactylos carnosus]
MTCDEAAYLASRRYLGLDGTSEISGLLSDVQDVDYLTENVINIVKEKIRDQGVRDYTSFVRAFVDMFMDSTNAPRMYTINKLLKKIVEINPPLAKIFAENILQHPRMNINLSTLIWNSAMDLLQFLVRYPDYKGIRDIFKQLLEKVQYLPIEIPIEDNDKVFKLYNVNII